MKNAGGKMTQLKRTAAFLLTLIFLISGGFNAFAAENKDVISAALEDTAAFLLKTVPELTIGSVGGEWAVIGLSRGGFSVPEDYYEKYYSAVERYVKERSGVLHEKKYTEYSRLILALTAIGKDPSNVCGYNLLEPLGDFGKTVYQGINGPIFALIALDSGNYAMPVCKEAKTQATREMYVNEILSRQLADGGFDLGGSKAGADITGMALQALAKYRDIEDVKTAVDRALSCLSKIQEQNGGYKSFGAVSSESAAQVLTALCELGIKYDDPRFVKNGKSLVDNILSYYTPGAGFLHTADGGGVIEMSTEQAFYSLVALRRVQTEKTSLYDMTDVNRSPVKDTKKMPRLKENRSILS
jgi:hypothetical protein